MRSGYPATEASSSVESIQILQAGAALRPSQATRLIFFLVFFGSAVLVESREPSRVV